MVQNTSLAPPGSLSGDRSTIAEKSERSRGSMDPAMRLLMDGMGCEIGPKSASGGVMNRALRLQESHVHSLTRGHHAPRSHFARHAWRARAGERRLYLSRRPRAA